MEFKASFSDPIYPDLIELGDISHDSIIDHFEKMDWIGYLQKSQTAKLDDIYYHPTFEVQNKETKDKLGISAVGNPNEFEFNIIYTRTKKVKVKSFFGPKEKTIERYFTIIKSQTKNDVLDCLNALIRKDTEYLSVKIGQ